ncbi:hypothetical protein D9613_012315 [Agrocybe pediades]|uniref:Pex19-domain-containing protein n=1 Tax=Agrocybe pediades TaxID=84607 RepID=A0A8H4QF56_9AGAR|nr:hypothetical protein D9613_012315 [Agrocybe pediades]
MSTTTNKPTLEKKTADPEEDLDDLDDVLDEFNAAPSPPPPTATTQQTFGRPRNNTRVDAPPTSIPGSGSKLDSTTEADEDLLSSEFAKELAAGMENLMREITGERLGEDASGSAEGSSSTMSEEERTRALKAAWEAMLVEGMDGNIGGAGGLEGLGGGNTSANSDGKAKEQGGTAFQDKIKQAMEKLKESESKFQASGANKNDPESLEDLLKSLGDLGLGAGGEDEQELAGFLENMMGQLMSKEVLYEPLKELADGFPGYLAKPPAPLSQEDRTRYQSQLECVRKILAVFEKPDYSDSTLEYNKQIVDLMSEMQGYGSPPTEIMGPLPPGLDGTNGIPGLGEDGCTIA